MYASFPFSRGWGIVQSTHDLFVSGWVGGGAAEFVASGSDNEDTFAVGVVDGGLHELGFTAAAQAHVDDVCAVICGKLDGFSDVGDGCAFSSADVLGFFNVDVLQVPLFVVVWVVGATFHFVLVVGLYKFGESGEVGGFEFSDGSAIALCHIYIIFSRELTILR